MVDSILVPNKLHEVTFYLGYIKLYSDGIKQMINVLISDKPYIP